LRPQLVVENNIYSNRPKNSWRQQAVTTSGVLTQSTITLRVIVTGSRPIHINLDKVTHETIFHGNVSSTDKAAG
jgi:hypothetical protein